MAQPHRPATPSSPENSDATEGLPASVTATRPQSDVQVPPAAAPPAAGPAGPGPGAGHDVGPDAGATDTRHDVDPGRGPGRRRLSRREGLILAVCALVGTGMGITGQRLTTSLPPAATPAASATPKPASTAPVQATITPVSPKDSSFALKNGVYTSETYSNATFGNLKKGIGLLLDLGTARPLTSVTFTADPGPLVAELRAGDTAASDGSTMTLVGKPVQANGATSLPATAGGRHRYWMIWVTQLPPGFKAKIANPVARG